MGAGTLCWTLLLLGPGAALAQRLSSDRVLDARLFRPAMDSRGLLSVNGTDVLPANAFSFGLILDGALNVVPFEGFVNDDTALAAEASREEHLIDEYLTGTLRFNYGLFDRFAVGIQIPVHAVGGENISVPGQYNEGGADQLDFQGFGDITLHAKARLFRADRDPLGVALVLLAELPTGTPGAFAGDGFTLWPSVAAEWRPTRWLTVAANGGYRLNFGDGAEFPVGGRTEPSAVSASGATLVSTGTTVEYGDAITGGVGAAFRFSKYFDVVGELYGSQLMGGLGDGEALSMEAGGGFRVFVQRHSYLVVAATAGLPTDGVQAADVRGIVGFIFEPAINDADGDGIADDIDECPNEPEDFDYFQDDDGCPDPDNDGDGILDRDDACPMAPEDVDGDQDDDGCPDGDLGDRDGDGIADDIDACPDKAEDFDEFEDEDGCPDLDNDGDGIMDKDDLCPLEPEDKDGWEDEDGCPEPDNDADRILDEDDTCPNEPETYNGFEDEDGCKDQGSVVVEGSQLVILDKIYFETASAKIQKRSYKIIDAVAATMVGNPHIQLIEVQGHADERGGAKYNLELTQARAASVVDALVERGVEPGRLRSEGYGEYCPIDPSHTPVAWEKNRRVEFKIVETEDGPTGVEVACKRARRRGK